MKAEIKVPVMGESVSEATVSVFLVPPGTSVTSGQEVVELETDKVNQVLYASADGTLTFSVQVGDVVKVGQVIGFIETDALEKKETASQVKQETPKEIKVDALKAPTKNEKEGSRLKMSMLRKTIAAKLVEVKNKTAMLTTFNEVDMSAVLALREQEKEAFFAKYGVKLGFMSFFTKASSSALKAYPLVNSYIEGDEIVSPRTIDIGVAVSTDKGLFVPVIAKADTLSYAEIEKKIAFLAQKAREGSIAMSDLQGGTFTITNGGVFGSLLSTPILNPPQSAILGMHAIVKRAVVINDEIVIRPMMYLALSYDHRIIDGKDAVLFLVHVKEYLENSANFRLHE